MRNISHFVARSRDCAEKVMSAPMFRVSHHYEERAESAFNTDNIIDEVLHVEIPVFLTTQHSLGHSRVGWVEHRGVCA